MSRLTRRRLLQAGAAGAAGFWVGGPLFAEEKKPTANERLHVAMIGVAGRGAEDLGGIAAAGAEIVALCDVVEDRAGKAREQFPRAKFVRDFRKLFDEKGIDAVAVATPDHTHAIATLLALRAGLHVYCEKPLTHTVHEARLVAETAKKMKRVTQMGTQIHAGDNYRRVVELIRAGAIGPVREVHTWVSRSWGGGDRPKEMPPVPAGLDWDLWLGPAPFRPYHPAYVPFNWRGWWDFGNGSLADFACHHMDLPFWALDLRHPTLIEARGDEAPHPESTAKALTVTYEFPARGEKPPVTLTWYDGGRRPPHFAQGKLPQWGDGNLFVGTKGMLLAGYSDYRLLPEKDFVGVKPDKSIPPSIGHHKEWVEACKTGGETTCHFDYGGALTEAALLGVVSYRAQTAIHWDGAAARAKESEAQKWLTKEYRKPWTL
jgi:predicted dehydrogenase